MGRIYNIFFGVVTVYAVSCSEGPERFMRFDEYMSSVSFSMDGRYMYVLSGRWEDEVEEQGYPFCSNVLRVYETGTWKQAFVIENTSGRATSAISCADSGVVADVETDAIPGAYYDCVCCGDLVFRSMGTGMELGRFEIDDHASRMTNSSDRYFCDMDSNTMYIRDSGNRVVALDGSSGGVMAEYMGTEDIYGAFLIQKDHDRLVMISTGYHKFTTYRLSTGELLKTLEIRPGGRNESYSLVNDSRLVFLVDDEKSGVGSGIFIFTIDLDKLAVTSESFLVGYIHLKQWIMDIGSDRILLGVEHVEDPAKSLLSANYVTGAVDKGVDLSNFMVGDVLAMPDIDRIFVEIWEYDGSRSGISAVHIYNYPQLDLLKVDSPPIRKLSELDEKVWVPSRQLIAMTDYSYSKMSFYNPVKMGDVGGAYGCTNLGGLTVDPTGRWAAAICDGIQPEDSILDIKYGMYPEHSGVLVVDMNKI